MVSQLEYGRITVAETFAENDGRDEDSLRPQTYTEQFEKVCPSYMAMGMTYEQFWDGDSEIVKAFRESYKLQQDIINRNAWLQGLYIYEALCDVAPILKPFSKARRPTPYPKEPYELDKKSQDNEQVVETKEEKSDKKARTLMEIFMVGFNQRKQKSLNGKEQEDG